VRRLERDYRAERAEAEALREGEARRWLLLDELRHRVKNTLAVVRGIAAQSLSGGRSRRRGTRSTAGCGRWRKCTLVRRDIFLPFLGREGPPDVGQVRRPAG
jgi:hypothetical protein